MNDFWMPPAHSTVAHEIDSLFYFIYYCSVFFFVAVVGAMTYFAFKYKRKAHEMTEPAAHNNTLEITWTVIPTILCLVVFVLGFRGYMKMNVVPKDALEIKVTGQKWFWSFDYPSGATTVNDIVIPVGKPVKLLMSSKDVIHSFYVAEFRTKRDVLPNRYSISWFEATSADTFLIQCTEYCGTSHSEMLGKVIAVSETEYNKWLETNSNPGEGLTPEAYGEKLYTSKACITCHSLDGKPGSGPSWKAIFGKSEKMTDGSSITVDENYIRESILNPQAKIVAGYQPVMPTYQGILKDREIDAIVAYIKTLK